MNAKAVIRMPGEGKQVSLAGKPLVFLVTGQDTKHTTMFDWTLPAGFSTGLHVHRTQEETFYVLEGELRIFLQDPKEEVPLKAGESFTARVRRPHLVTNGGENSATFLVLQGIGAYDFVPLVKPR